MSGRPAVRKFLTLRVTNLQLLFFNVQLKVEGGETEYVCTAPGTAIRWLHPPRVQAVSHMQLRNLRGSRMPLTSPGKLETECVAGRARQIEFVETLTDARAAPGVRIRRTRTSYVRMDRCLKTINDSETTIKPAVHVDRSTS